MKGVVPRLRPDSVGDPANATVYDLRRFTLDLFGTLTP